MSCLQGKKTLVLGLGETGLAAARWLARKGAQVRVADTRDDPPQATSLLAAVPQAELLTGAFAPATFAGAELIVISPGVPARQPLVEQAVRQGAQLVSEIELFAREIHAQPRLPKVIAITGSNGKTTTTALTGELCRAAGHCTAVAGNIGPAALDALAATEDSGEPAAVWVLELSSFQLETTHTLAADAATLLNISEDHLDRYTGLADYARSKRRIFQGSGVMVLNRDDPCSLAAAQAGRTLITFGLDAPPGSADYGLADGFLLRGDERLLALGELRLSGRHNVLNAMAALALCEAIGIEIRSVLPSLAAFKGLPHRVQWIAEIGGVVFIDDSKGTNVGATLAALQGMQRKVAIILGGEGKGQDFQPLKAAIADHARAVALIGRDAPTIADALSGCPVPQHHCADMREAVSWCAAHAQSGDAVLLSPACASMDMYRDYAHRAQVFIDAVQRLARKREIT